MGLAVVEGPVVSGMLDEEVEMGPAPELGDAAAVLVVRLPDARDSEELRGPAVPLLVKAGADPDDAGPAVVAFAEQNAQEELEAPGVPAVPLVERGAVPVEMPVERGPTVEEALP